MILTKQAVCPHRKNALVQLSAKRFLLFLGPAEKKVLLIAYKK